MAARVHPGLCHSTGMPSNDKGKQTALNELERHDACAFFYHENTARAPKADGATLRVLTEVLFAAAASLEARFPRQSARLVFMVDTQAVWG